jgi:hypothetical protein
MRNRLGIRLCKAGVGVSVGWRPLVVLTGRRHDGLWVPCFSLPLWCHIQGEVGGAQIPPVDLTRARFLSLARGSVPALCLCPVLCGRIK